MEVNLFVDGTRYLVLKPLQFGNSILELLQKGNFAVVAATAASIQSYNNKQQQ